MDVPDQDFNMRLGRIPIRDDIAGLRREDEPVSRIYLSGSRLLAVAQMRANGVVKLRRQDTAAGPTLC